MNTDWIAALLDVGDFDPASAVAAAAQVRPLGVTIWTRVLRPRGAAARDRLSRQARFLHRIPGRAPGDVGGTDGRPRARRGHFIHSAVDDNSRLSYSEILTNEKKDTAAGFWTRANAQFAVRGMTVERALTDNGSC